MRNIDPAQFRASEVLLPAVSRDPAPARLVCLALAIAIFVLGCRVASLW